MTAPNMRTEIAGHTLGFCVWNASGPLCSTVNQLEALGRSASPVMQAKSATFEPRTGNPLPRWWASEKISINSEGLPNKGIHYYAGLGEKLAAHGKPYVLSISGLKPGENLKMMKIVNKAPKVSWVEVNLSCPNIPGKPLLAYDFDALEQTLAELVPASNLPIGVKLPPYFDVAHFKRVADILNKHSGAISFVVCCNTIGNGLIIDPELEEPVIARSFGGIAGFAAKATALANVKKFSELLRGIDVVGAGGIQTGKDVFEFILCGAKACMVATEFRKEGPRLFARLERELREIMAAKGYKSLSDFQGKLKPAGTSKLQKNAQSKL